MDIAHQDKYVGLPTEFKNLIDHYEKTHRAMGNSPSYIHSIHKTSAFFLHAMQQRGHQRISEITEEDVVSFFNGKYDGKCRGHGTAEFIRRVFKCGMEWKPKECGAILVYLPKFPRARKLLPYLGEEEIAKLRCLVDDPCSDISLRDRAICLALIFTGLRRGDIAAMRLDDIDWEHSRISIRQEKTGQVVTVPMVPVLGNALYDSI